MFIAMRYWRPLTEAAAAAVAAFAPDEVVLLPLYPQFSTTTTASSLAAWDASLPRRRATRARSAASSTQTRLIEAHADADRAAWASGRLADQVRLLFSAHGLPESIVGSRRSLSLAGGADRAGGGGAAGRGLGLAGLLPEPGRADEVARALDARGDRARPAREGLGVIVDPIAFVSEHVETLVELDRDYARVAPSGRRRRPTSASRRWASQPRFIEALADAGRAGARRGRSVAPGGRRLSEAASAAARCERRRGMSHLGLLP